jgi:hypothetical protein
MDYESFMWIKLGILCVGAFVWGFIRRAKELRGQSESKAD